MEIKELYNLFKDPIFIGVLTFFMGMLAVSVGLYISANLGLYRIERSKYLGLDSSSFDSNFALKKISILDKFIINSQLKKNKKYRYLFNKMYAIETEKAKKRNLKKKNGKKNIQ